MFIFAELLGSGAACATPRRALTEDNGPAHLIAKEPTTHVHTQFLSGPAMNDATSAYHPRHLVIISRYHRALYDYVRARFASEDAVEVILDRRSGRDRRATLTGPQVERRLSERRTRPHIDRALRMESMQFLTIPSMTSGACPSVPDSNTTME